MIAIENSSGELIRAIKNADEMTLGFHKLFGFVGEENAKRRITQRKIKGHEFDNDTWLCKFKVKKSKDSIKFESIENCELDEINNNSWSIKTPLGEFFLKDSLASVIHDDLVNTQAQAKWLEPLLEKILFILFLIIPILYFLTADKEQEVISEKKETVEPISVKIVKPAQTVNISRSKPDMKVKPLTESQKSKRAVKRNLGFLGLVGSKDLSKAVGGVPQKLKKASAGAGKGGDAGSGGEVLTGIGKGIKKITVGNTGVAGLGGVGTKGAGGGAGGYGNTVVASGEGEGITSIAVGSQELVLEGGLSKYAINATIAKYLSQVRRCYEKRLNVAPNLTGVVTVAFQINGSGALNYSKIKNTTLNDSQVEKCITNKMMSWKFPKPKGGVNVNIKYPFMLRPVGN